MKVFRGFAGSYLYGLQNENSDLDIIEIYIPKIEDEICLRTDKINPTQELTSDHKDITKYDIASFFRALNKGSMQLIEILFTENNSIIEDSYIFELLQEFRYKLISENSIKKNIYGFAQGRLDKIFKSLNLKTKLYIVLQDNLDKSDELLTGLVTTIKDEKAKDIINEYLNLYSDGYCINIIFNCEKDVLVKQDLIQYDHKSIYQILRVLYTIKNLLETGNAFPYTSDIKKFLLNVKCGMVDFLSLFYEAKNLISILSNMNSQIYINEDKYNYMNALYLEIFKIENSYKKYLPNSIKKYLLKKVFIKGGV